MARIFKVVTAPELRILDAENMYIPTKETYVLDYRSLMPENRGRYWEASFVETFATEHLLLNSESLQLNNNEKVYCVKGHNITKENWNTLSEIGFRKTIKMDDADYIAVSPKVFTNMFTSSWNVELHDKSLTENLVDRFKNHIIAEGIANPEAQNAVTVFQKIVDGINNYFQRHEYIAISIDFSWQLRNTQPEYRLIHEFLSVRDNPGLSSVYIQKSKLELFDTIFNNRDRVINQLVLLNISSDSKSIIDRDYYDQLSNMIRSTDKGNRELALRIITACNVKESHAYLALLFAMHSDFFVSVRNNMRDAESKAFITEYNSLLPDTMWKEKASITIPNTLKNLKEIIHYNNQFTSDVHDVLLEYVKNELVKSIRSTYTDVIDLDILKNSVVLK